MKSQKEESKSVINDEKQHHQKPHNPSTSNSSSAYPSNATERLTSLFAPPTPIALQREKTTQTTDNKAKEASTPDAAASLQGLFAPPTESQISTLGDIISTIPAPSTANPTPLQGLFAPPPGNENQKSERTNITAAPLLANLFQAPGRRTTADETTALLSSLFAPPTESQISTLGDIISAIPAPPPANPTHPLQGLFVPPPGNESENQKSERTNITATPLLANLFQAPGRRTTADETTALLSNPSSDFYIGSVSPSPITVPVSMVGNKSDSPLAAASAIEPPNIEGEAWKTKLSSAIKDVGSATFKAQTFAGAFMFLLYHVVFCLANGSAIIRPNSMDKPILGIMAKLSTVGIMVSGPFYILRLGTDVPALYPSIDLFLAPFLAKAAMSVDQSLADTYSGGYPEEVFFCSFCVLTAIGMFLSGCLLQLGATFKLANLGTFLPYSVLCGFFSAVGVLLWALAFSVDTSGRTWEEVFFSGDSHLIMESLLHHMPSLFMGILMNRLGPKNPFFVLLLIFVTLGLFYLTMLLTGTSLQEAQEAHWFWSREELIVDKSDNPFQPIPLCNIRALFSSATDWKAVQDGLGHMVALAFLYLLRSSIHASAMKKNVGNLVRRVPKSKQEIREHNPQEDSDEEEDISSVVASVRNRLASSAINPLSSTFRASNVAPGVIESVRQTVQQVQLSLRHDTTNSRNIHHNQTKSDAFDMQGYDGDPEPIMYTEVRAKPTSQTLEEIFIEYGYALYVVSVLGGFGCCPTVATSNTMYAIGADGRAPQLGSILLLLIFYFTEFEIVKYIPKAAFSSLLVLGAVDTLAVWFFGAFRKTQDTTEWLVVPIIVGFSLVIGFLNAVFLGIGISTFVFVAAFFRVGIVKFHATGKDIRSRIERSMSQSVFLNENGDQIQVLVLQNYLFFGNAGKLCNYIATMFEEVEENEVDFSVPPMPKVVVIDFSLITGLDTSTVDIFSDIKETCVSNDCKIYLTGLSTRMRKSLALGGVKPESNLPRKQRSVRLFQDMDSGLGKAEDYIIMLEGSLIGRSLDAIRFQDQACMSGFRFSLKQIDELHCHKFAESLIDLEPFVDPLQLNAGEILFACDGGIVTDEERGLFFIESGMLKISRDSSLSLTLNRTRSYGHLGSLGAGAQGTLGHQHARIGSFARKAAQTKEHGTDNLRLARIGPGWVVGTLENASGSRSPGVFTAVTRCSLHRLPFSRLQELEETNPILVLQLYKMLSHLMARKQEITTEHLSTLHTIMSSPAYSKPPSIRSSLGSLSKGSQGLG